MIGSTTVPMAAPGSSPADTISPGDERASRLTRAVAGGDSEALAALYDEWFDKALRMAKSVTRRDESFCLDVAQEAMLRTARTIPHLGSSGALEAWMRRVVVTSALDLLKSERRRTGREVAATKPESSQSPHDAAELSEQIERVSAMLRSLPEQHGWLVALRYLRGFTFDQAAESTDQTAGAAHGRLRRLVATLRDLASSTRKP